MEGRYNIAGRRNATNKKQEHAGLFGRWALAIFELYLSNDPPNPFEKGLEERFEREEAER
jgi:hypothetical protein